MIFIAYYGLHSRTATRVVRAITDLNTHQLGTACRHFIQTDLDIYIYYNLPTCMPSSTCRTASWLRPKDVLECPIC